MEKNKKPKVQETYEERYKRAQKENQTRQVSFSITQWEEEGKVLIGKLVKVEKVSSKELGGTFEGEVNKYLFDTDEGRVSCVCGTSVDRVIDAHKEKFVGYTMAIEYQGKRTLSGNREFNLFRVDIISMSGDDDIPY